MKSFKDCSDQTLYNLWMSPAEGTRLDAVYQFMTDYLYNAGYDDVTVHKVRRRIKWILKRWRLLPPKPTQADYHQSRQLPKNDLTA